MQLKNIVRVYLRRNWLNMKNPYYVQVDCKQPHLATNHVYHWSLGRFHTEELKTYCFEFKDKKECQTFINSIALEKTKEASRFPIPPTPRGHANH